MMVRDLDRVTTYYRDVLGLTVQEHTRQVAILGVAGVALLQLIHRLPTAPMWTGARLAAAGITEGLGASMRLLYARVRTATIGALRAVHLRNVSRSGRQNQLGSIPFSWRGTLFRPDWATCTQTLGLLPRRPGAVHYVSAPGMKQQMCRVPSVSRHAKAAAG